VDGSRDRPGLPSRHSFTAYEENKAIAAPRDRPRPLSARPIFPRSKTSTAASTISRPGLSLLSGQGEPGHVLNQQALEEHDAEAEQQGKPIWEPATGGSPPKSQGRVLSVLQSLDYEADPLIDHNGVHRILERGRFDGRYPGVIMRGNGYEGVLSEVTPSTPGVTPPP
jgi:hypothetical protein